jgi:hypothetical protein
MAYIKTAAENERVRLAMKHMRARRRKLKKRKCKLCGHTFFLLHMSNLYCGDACRKKGYRQNRLRAAKKNHQKVKAEGIAHYSNGKNCCDCCGENNINFLCFDHFIATANANPGSWKSRRDSAAFLKQRGWPPGIQILCYNCNYGKRKNDTCPHKW